MAQQNKFTRREFLKDAAIASAAVAASSVLGSTPASAAPVPAKWDKEAEVVIVGYGGGAAVTAITAFDAGAKVLILEKQPADKDKEVWHTPSSRMASGAVQNWHNKEDAIKYLTFCSRGATPDDVIASWADYAIHSKEWFVGIGGKVVARPQDGSEYPNTIIPGVDSYDVWGSEGGGSGMFATLAKAVESRKIEIQYETPAKRLIVDASGQVVGVLAQQGGKDYNVKASKGVVLACGGFEYDFELVKNFYYGYPNVSYANPDNKGDGLRMAQAIGAALWHMEVGSGRLMPFFPELGYGISGGTSRQPFIIVDKYGKRFVRWPWSSHNAWQSAWWYDAELGDSPRIPSFLIMDDTVIKGGPLLAGGDIRRPNYTWSKDNSAEIAKGWILKADTIAQLASVIGKDAEDQDAFGKAKMKPEVLADTVTRYNQYCAAGKDPEMGNDPKIMKALATPPFYAMKLYPGGSHTIGGPKRNAKSQVVNAFNEPIARLYEVGELGSILGFLEAGAGWNLLEVITSGQIAGKAIVAEKPWVAT